MKLSELFESQETTYELSISKLSSIRGLENQSWVPKRIYKGNVQLPTLSWRQWTTAAYEEPPLDLKNLHDDPIETPKKLRPIDALITAARKAAPQLNLKYSVGYGAEYFDDAFVLQVGGVGGWYKLRLRLA